MICSVAAGPLWSPWEERSSPSTTLTNSTSCLLEWEVSTVWEDILPVRRDALPASSARPSAPPRPSPSRLYVVLSAVVEFGLICCSCRLLVPTVLVVLLVTTWMSPSAFTAVTAKRLAPSMPSLSLLSWISLLRPEKSSTTIRPNCFTTVICGNLS